ncbi:MAG: aminotransferase class IV [Verrucomicrobiales bacterium]|nr:aminotransferase class IV [Verrucomicrobiales bacterium]
MSSESPTPTYLLANGEWKPEGSPLLPVDDRAVSVGAGLFETLAAYRGKPFAFDRHMARLEAGLSALGIPLRIPDEWGTALPELLKRNQLLEAEQARLRITVTAGTPETGPRWFIEASEAPTHPVPARLITGPFVRNERSLLAGYKTINYGDNEIAMRLAHEAGATEALFGNTRDQICEGTWSNIFISCGGKWLTPPLSSGCLPGVTRSIVLQLAEEEGQAIEETDLPLSSIPAIEAAFLTSSIREIQPVESIDAHTLLSPENPQLAAWQRAFRDYVNS